MKILLQFFLGVLIVVSTVFAQPNENTDYINILKRAGGYTTETDSKLPPFFYQSSNDTYLVSLRSDFKLDSVAGFGNEISRILNLLHWVHNTVTHDGQKESGIIEVNARSILTTYAQKKIGVSCGELATLLNDIYLAMGWLTRKIYCMPLDSAGTDNDSHVINAVYLSSLKKWIWVDPTHDAYIMDEKGDLLGIREVRERIINGQALIVNPDANWNRRSSSTKDYYLLKYMAKNLYRLYTPLKSVAGYEDRNSSHKVEYVHLYPLSQFPKIPFIRNTFNAYLGKNTVNFTIYNADVFWQVGD